MKYCNFYSLIFTPGVILTPSAIHIERAVHGSLRIWNSFLVYISPTKF